MRSMASYNASLGGRGKLKAWIFAIRNQSASAWDRRYTSAAAVSYIRDGFAHAESGGCERDGNGCEEGEEQKCSSVSVVNARFVFVVIVRFVLAVAARFVNGCAYP